MRNSESHAYFFVHCFLASKLWSLLFELLTRIEIALLLLTVFWRLDLEVLEEERMMKIYGDVHCLPPKSMLSLSKGDH